MCWLAERRGGCCRTAGLSNPSGTFHRCQCRTRFLDTAHAEEPTSHGSLLLCASPREGRISNIVRFIPSIPGYVYTVRDTRLYVTLFRDGGAQIDLGNDETEVIQETDYSRDGEVRITVRPRQALATHH